MALDISVELLLVLFVVASVAGWVDAIAGGGGLLTVPAMLVVGLPPASAIATNKLQGSVGTLVAALFFIRRGAVSVSDNASAIITVCVGAVCGGFVITRVDVSLLDFIVPVLLASVAVYYLLFAGDLDASRTAPVERSYFNKTVVPGLGFYDGFFGPGTGSLMTSSYVAFRGMPIKTATAHAKVLNCASNVAALVSFLVFGEIALVVGVVMLVGQLIGAYFGARAAWTAGARLIKPMIVVMCLAMTAFTAYRAVGSWLA